MQTKTLIVVAWGGNIAIGIVFTAAIRHIVFCFSLLLLSSIIQPNSTQPLVFLRFQAALQTRLLSWCLAACSFPLLLTPALRWRTAHGQGHVFALAITTTITVQLGALGAFLHVMCPFFDRRYGMASQTIPILLVELQTSTSSSILWH